MTNYVLPRCESRQPSLSLAATLASDTRHSGGLVLLAWLRYLEINPSKLIWSGFVGASRSETRAKTYLQSPQLRSNKKLWQQRAVHRPHQLAFSFPIPPGAKSSHFSVTWHLWYPSTPQNLKTQYWWTTGWKLDIPSVMHWVIRQPLIYFL